MKYYYKKCYTMNSLNKFITLHLILGARGGVVCLGTALQAGRSQVQFHMGSLEFFIDINLPAAL
jgi:hypothetical protein